MNGGCFGFRVARADTQVLTVVYYMHDVLRARKPGLYIPVTT